MSVTVYQMFLVAYIQGSISWVQLRVSKWCSFMLELFRVHNHHSFQGFAVKGKFTQKTQFDCFRLGKVLYHVIICGNNLSARQNVWKNMFCQQVLADSLIHCNPLFNFPFLISKTVICSFRDNQNHFIRFCLCRHDICPKF